MSKIFTKRVTRDLQLIKKKPIDNVKIYVSDNDLSKWYFKFNGDNDTSYKNGEYIGLITLPKEYPFKAPTFKMLTPSGRFEINKTICMSNSHFHPEEWSPMWTLSQLLIGFVSLFDDDLESHIGISHIKTTPEKKKKMAIKSKEYNDTIKENKYFI